MKSDGRTVTTEERQGLNALVEAIRRKRVQATGSRQPEQLGLFHGGRKDKPS